MLEEFTSQQDMKMKNLDGITSAITPLKVSSYRT
jgi:hypothetical protein